MNKKLILVLISFFHFCQSSDNANSSNANSVSRLALRRPSTIRIKKLKPVKTGDDDYSCCWYFCGCEEPSPSPKTETDKDKELFEECLNKELKKHIPLSCKSVDALELLWAKWSRKKHLDEECYESCLEMRKEWSELEDTDQKFRAIVLLKYASHKCEASTAVKTLISLMLHNFQQQFPYKFGEYCKQYQLPTPAVRNRSQL